MSYITYSLIERSIKIRIETETTSELVTRFELALIERSIKIRIETQHFYKGAMMEKL